ncbi:putative Formyl transferase [Trypanosoma vivax]|uniref:Putative methionyl-tRNA formyltransferase n=1 Tax=Trypanosoma vivax (strain Y486) TaxID=1055687 RepID=G0U958_TRYVY|nr:putative methionyl-tRNA formyltransferase [Trypanosoma vivax]KAH8605113.1 putative Formyl transferase [Trypanosoma vivax]CCC54142.1 putative methionyl-tRNA formyltransferase [Trypanosoma vivax Y486]
MISDSLCCRCSGVLRLFEWSGSRRWCTRARTGRAISYTRLCQSYAPINTRNLNESSSSVSCCPTDLLTPPRTPSIIFFGGDIVSLIILRALHERMRSVTCGLKPTAIKELEQKPGCDLGPQLVVVCPFLPGNPAEVCRRFSRQYPLARYCVEHNIPLVPVDHPTSLARSNTLQQLLKPRRARSSGDNTLHNSLEMFARVPHLEEEEEVNYVAGQPLEDFDVAVVASFRYFMPDKLLRRLRRTINVHPSLLPRYRGASPIFAPLLRGDSESGVSIAKLQPSQLMDGGDVLLRRMTPIPPEMTIREYFPRITQLCAATLCECLFGPPALAASNPSTEDSSFGKSNSDLVNAHNDWPKTFDALWINASRQNYHVHFTKDPFHAPMLPKDAALIRWESVNADEAYGIWRAFVGGEYFSPTVNTQLDKGATPVREQLVKRIMASVVRRRAKFDCGLSCTGGKPLFQKQSLENGYLSGDRITRAKKDSEDNASLSNSEMSGAVMKEIERQLRVRCAFTEATHPRYIPNALLEELQRLRVGGDGSALDHTMKPGSAYFPKTAEDMCAVRCREGWFVWSAAALEGSPARPVALLRKGMAMKCGVIYVGLFC